LGKYLWIHIHVPKIDTLVPKIDTLVPKIDTLVPKSDTLYILDEKPYKAIAKPIPHPYWNVHHIGIPQGQNKDNIKTYKERVLRHVWS